MLATVWLSWGFAYPLTGIALDGLDPWTLRCAVMLLGGSTLLTIAALRGQRLAVPRVLWRDLVIGAIFNMTLFQVGMMFGVYFMGAGRTSVLIYTMPIWSALFARWLLGEAITPRRALALALGALAVVVLLGQSLTQVRNAPLGALLTLGSAASFGFGTVWTKRTAWPLDLTVLGGWQILVSGLPYLPFWLFELPEARFLQAPLNTWLSVLYLALFSNALAYFAWLRLVRVLPASVLGVGTLIVPCVGVLSSALLIGETIQRNDVIALVLVCGALGLVLFEPHRPAALRPEPDINM
ncbi:MAG: DMT family transporter [Pseudomonadota bacterium]